MVSEKIKIGILLTLRFSERCNVTAARISDVANNKIDCQLSTFMRNNWIKNASGNYLILFLILKSIILN
jgi:hypothetical protein